MRLSHSANLLKPMCPLCPVPCCAVPCCAFQANYGQKDAAAVAKVKEVYSQLGMAGRFEAYEVESYS
jgi:hypothetical protein